MTNDTISRFNDHFRSAKDVLFIRKLRDGGLTDKQIAVVVGVLESICLQCMDSENPCCCWNDE